MPGREDLVQTDWAERAMGSCYVGRSGHRASSTRIEPTREIFQALWRAFGVLNYRQS